VQKLQEMEFYLLNAATLILYCTRDPCHKRLLVAEVVLESNDNYANGITAWMIYLSKLQKQNMKNIIQIKRLQAGKK